MNMQTTTNYFCLSYKSFFVCWHFEGLQIVDSQPKTGALIRLIQWYRKSLCLRPSSLSCLGDLITSGQLQT